MEKYLIKTLNGNIADKFYNSQKAIKTWMQKNRKSHSMIEPRI